MLKPDENPIKTQWAVILVAAGWAICYIVMLHFEHMSTFEKVIGILSTVYVTATGGEILGSRWIRKNKEKKRIERHKARMKNLHKN